MVMEVMNISKSGFKKLKKYVLDKRIYNTEADFYLINEKSKWEKRKKLLKFLFNDIGEVFSNKLFTINELVDNKDLIDIPELVFPEKLAVIDEKVVGFTLEYIDNINFDLILQDCSISNAEKIEMFKQIGNILKKMKRVRENTKINDFFLNDLQERNFVLNKKTNKINVVDLDSCKINCNKAFAARYLTPFSPVATMPKKYIQNREILFPGFIIADENTDYYCYIIMILNFLYKDNITKLSIDEFYIYLDYLRSLGLNYELLDKFAKIYEYTDNENVKDYLDLISDDIIHKSRKIVFEKKVR